MTRIIMAYVGVVNGVKAYAPMDQSDVDAIGDKTTIVADMKGDRSMRTEAQRRAQHLYFDMLAKAFNDAGLGMTEVMQKLSKKAKLPWSGLAVKERLWKPTQKHTYGESSTTKLEPGQVCPVYEALNEVTSSVLGVGVPFPDRYNQILEQLGNN